VQHSVITANSFGFFFRGVNSPLDLGSNFISSGTIPAGFKESASAGMARLYRRKRDSHPHEVDGLGRKGVIPKIRRTSAGRGILPHLQNSPPQKIGFILACFADSFRPSRSKASSFLIYWASSP
jgi:hypothetical protein